MQRNLITYQIVLKEKTIKETLTNGEQTKGSGGEAGREGLDEIWALRRAPVVRSSVRCV